MSGGRSVSFEVYYLQYGRWQIHHRYTLNEREAAIDEAKRLDKQGHFDAACVVRESFDHGSGIANESVIYHSPKLKTQPPVANVTSGAEGGSANTAASKSNTREVLRNAPSGSTASNAAALAKKRVAGQKTMGGKNAPTKEPDLRRPPKVNEAQAESDWAAAIPKLLVGFLIACLVGTIAGIGGYYALKGLTMVGLNFGSKVNQFILVGAWFAGWIVTFVPVLRRVMRNIQVSSSSSETEPVSPAVSTTSNGAEAALAAKALDDAAKRLEEAEKNAKPSQEQVALDSFTLRDEKDGPAETDPDPKDKALPVEPPPNIDDQDEEPEDLPAPPKTQEPTGPGPLRAALQDIVRDAKAASANTLDKDHFLRFGVILFLAGAAETLARRFKVAAKEVRKLLSEQIEAMGAPASMAKGFAANIDEYLLDKRFFEMYSLGRGSALKQGQDPNASSGFADALKMWKTPKPPPGQTPEGINDPKHYDDPSKGPDSFGFVSVLFTDIVNSTKNQQEKGDEWLMNVVRAHNDIVREAITKYGGREIKHTGDGIMASFPAVIPSLDAALSMQDGISKFSSMMKDLAFEVSIGISAGEPIHESGDLFGTPVNMAARVLSKAGARQIAVSSVVKDLCQGKNFIFEELGQFDLKGFSEPQPIYIVVERRATPRPPS
ncbi:MAG: adenylate/guanylate cyclase domain-containing protein [Alphaproteobacteria bacterium]|nr:adenylate/guanylate cyclase domain-containing protein [Alphaproteobacteria bacterium]